MKYPQLVSTRAVNAISDWLVSRLEQLGVESPQIYTRFLLSLLHSSVQINPTDPIEYSNLEKFSSSRKGNNNKRYHLPNDSVTLKKLNAVQCIAGLVTAEEQEIENIEILVDELYEKLQEIENQTTDLDTDNKDTILLSTLTIPTFNNNNHNNVNSNHHDQQQQLQQQQQQQVNQTPSNQLNGNSNGCISGAGIVVVGLSNNKKNHHHHNNQHHQNHQHHQNQHNNKKDVGVVDTSSSFATTAIVLTTLSPSSAASSHGGCVAVVQEDKKINTIEETDPKKRYFRAFPALSKEMEDSFRILRRNAKSLTWPIVVSDRNNLSLSSSSSSSTLSTSFGSSSTSAGAVTGAGVGAIIANSGVDVDGEKLNSLATISAAEKSGGCVDRDRDRDLGVSVDGEEIKNFNRRITFGGGATATAAATANINGSRGFADICIKDNIAVESSGGVVRNIAGVGAGTGAGATAATKRKSRRRRNQALSKGKTIQNLRKNSIGNGTFGGGLRHHQRDTSPSYWDTDFAGCWEMGRDLIKEFIVKQNKNLRNRSTSESAAYNFNKEAAAVRTGGAKINVNKKMSKVSNDQDSLLDTSGSLEEMDGNLLNNSNDENNRSDDDDSNTGTPSTADIQMVATDAATKLLAGVTAATAAAAAAAAAAADTTSPTYMIPVVDISFCDDDDYDDGNLDVDEDGIEDYDDNTLATVSELTADSTGNTTAAAARPLYQRDLLSHGYPGTSQESLHVANVKKSLINYIGAGGNHGNDDGGDDEEISSDFAHFKAKFNSSVEALWNDVEPAARTINNILHYTPPFARIMTTGNGPYPIYPSIDPFKENLKSFWTNYYNARADDNDMEKTTLDNGGVICAKRFMDSGSGGSGSSDGSTSGGSVSGSISYIYPTDILSDYLIAGVDPSFRDSSDYYSMPTHLEDFDKSVGGLRGIRNANRHSGANGANGGGNKTPVNVFLQNSIWSDNHPNAIVGGDTDESFYFKVWNSAMKLNQLDAGKKIATACDGFNSASSNDTSSSCIGNAFGFPPYNASKWSEGINAGPHPVQQIQQHHVDKSLLQQQQQQQLLQQLQQQKPRFKMFHQAALGFDCIDSIEKPKSNNNNLSSNFGAIGSGGCTTTSAAGGATINVVEGEAINWQIGGSVERPQQLSSPIIELQQSVTASSTWHGNDYKQFPLNTSSSTNNTANNNNNNTTVVEQHNICGRPMTPEITLPNHSKIGSGFTAYTKIKPMMLALKQQDSLNPHNYSAQSQSQQQQQQQAMYGMNPCYPDDENLLSSERTHFNPIKSYADGHTFDISGALDIIDYDRRETGYLYLDNEKYAEYVRDDSLADDETQFLFGFLGAASATPLYASSNCDAAKAERHAKNAKKDAAAAAAAVTAATGIGSLDSSVGADCIKKGNCSGGGGKNVDDFVLKFRVRGNEIACQTEDEATIRNQAKLQQQLLEQQQQQQQRQPMAYILSPQARGINFQNAGFLCQDAIEALNKAVAVAERAAAARNGLTMNNQWLPQQNNIGTTTTATTISNNMNISVPNNSIGNVGGGNGGTIGSGRQLSSSAAVASGVGVGSGIGFYRRLPPNNATVWNAPQMPQFRDDICRDEVDFMIDNNDDDDDGDDDVDDDNDVSDSPPGISSLTSEPWSLQEMGKMCAMKHQNHIVAGSGQQLNLLATTNHNSLACNNATVAGNCNDNDAQLMWNMCAACNSEFKSVPANRLLRDELQLEADEIMSDLKNMQDLYIGHADDDEDDDDNDNDNEDEDVVHHDQRRNDCDSDENVETVEENEINDSNGRDNYGLNSQKPFFDYFFEGNDSSRSIYLAHMDSNGPRVENQTNPASTLPSYNAIGGCGGGGGGQAVLQKVNRYIADMLQADTLQQQQQQQQQFTTTAAAAATTNAGISSTTSRAAAAAAATESFGTGFWYSGKNERNIWQPRDIELCNSPYGISVMTSANVMKPIDLLRQLNVEPKTTIPPVGDDKLLQWEHENLAELWKQPSMDTIVDNVANNTDTVVDDDVDDVDGNANASNVDEMNTASGVYYVEKNVTKNFKNLLETQKIAKDEERRGVGDAIVSGKNSFKFLIQEANKQITPLSPANAVASPSSVTKQKLINRKRRHSASQDYFSSNADAETAAAYAIAAASLNNKNKNKNKSKSSNNNNNNTETADLNNFDLFSLTPSSHHQPNDMQQIFKTREMFGKQKQKQEQNQIYDLPIVSSSSTSIVIDGANGADTLMEYTLGADGDFIDGVGGTAAVVDSDDCYIGDGEPQQQNNQQQTIITCKYWTTPLGDLNTIGGIVPGRQHSQVVENNANNNAENRCNIADFEDDGDDDDERDNILCEQRRRNVVAINGDAIVADNQSKFSCLIDKNASILKHVTMLTRPLTR